MEVKFWWALLSGLALLNLLLWGLSARYLFAKIRLGLLPHARAWHLPLSFLYTAGCAFRSVLPRADVQRICLYDSWLSSVAVGRSVATVAELCFVAQWALLTYEYSRELSFRPGRAAALVMVPLIFVAECFSWTAVLRTWYLGNAVEESLWALTAMILVVTVFFLRNRAGARLSNFLTAVLFAGLAYVGFMVLVDVPMYVNRYLADQAIGKEYLGLAQGWSDAATRWRVTFSLDEWRTEIPWMSLYFSLAVWTSIFAPQAPPAQEGLAED